MFASWVGLLLAGALGTFQPGSPVSCCGPRSRGSYPAAPVACWEAAAASRQFEALDNLGCGDKADDKDQYVGSPDGDCGTVHDRADVGLGFRRRAFDGQLAELGSHRVKHKQHDHDHQIDQAVQAHLPVQPRRVRRKRPVARVGRDCQRN